MCVFVPTYWQYCFIISKARFIISLQQGYILYVVKTGSRGHAHHEVTCIPLLHITSRASSAFCCSAYLDCSRAPTHKEARSDSQSGCSVLSVAERCILGFYVPACERHPRHLSVTVVLSDWGSAGDEGLFGIPHHTWREQKLLFLWYRRSVWTHSHTHTHTDASCTSIVARTFIGLMY